MITRERNASESCVRLRVIDLNARHQIRYTKNMLLYNYKSSMSARSSREFRTRFLVCGPTGDWNDALRLSGGCSSEPHIEHSNRSQERRGELRLGNHKPHTPASAHTVHTHTNDLLPPNDTIGEERTRDTTCKANKHDSLK